MTSHVNAQEHGLGHQLEPLAETTFLTRSGRTPLTGSVPTNSEAAPSNVIVQPVTNPHSRSMSQGIVTLNVRGLNGSKLLNVIFWMRERHLSLAILTETHLSTSCA